MVLSAQVLASTCGGRVASCVSGNSPHSPHRTRTLICLGLPRVAPQGNFTIPCEERTIAPFQSEITGTREILSDF